MDKLHGFYIDGSILKLRCNKCAQLKHAVDFHYDKRSETGRFGICRDCINAQRRMWAAERRTQGVKRDVKPKSYSDFGITLAEYDEMFRKQNGVCAICKLPEITRRLAVDHNHKTGKVRELLCAKCNRLLGFAAEDKQTLQSAINYLERHG